MSASDVTAAVLHVPLIDTVTVEVHRCERVQHVDVTFASVGV